MKLDAKYTDDYSKMSDKDLLAVYNAKTGGIPMKAVNEVHKRKLVKSYTGTWNSNMEH